MSRVLATGLAFVGIGGALVCGIRAILGFRKRRERRGSPQSLVKKVTSDTCPDLFYLIHSSQLRNLKIVGSKLSFTAENIEGERIISMEGWI